MEYPRTIQALRAFVQKVVRTSSTERLSLPVTAGGGSYNAFTASGNGTTTVFQVTHALGYVPQAVVTPATQAAATPFWVEADSELLSIHYVTAPASGTDNLSWNYILNEPLL